MGMGTFAVNSFVIEYDELKKICPDEISAIENEKFFDDILWTGIAQWLTWDDPDQLKDVMYDSYANVAEEEDIDDIVEQYVKIYDKHIINLKNSFNSPNSFLNLCV